MTKEEAIYLLRNTAWLAPSLEPVEEAVEMATEALQRTPNAHPTHECVEPTHECVDLISKQAAIDAIEMVEWYHLNQHKEMVSGANSDEHQAWYKAEDVYEAIEAVPSAEPKTGEWIHSPNGIDRDFMWECSECGNTIYSETEKDRKEFHAYCGRCGADMRERSE